MHRKNEPIVRMGLLRKKAAWSAEDFQYHWRDRHGRLVSSIPHLREYWQNRVVDRLQRGIDFARGPWDFDGVSQLWLDDPDEAGPVFTQGALSSALSADEQHFLAELHIVAARQTEVIEIPAEPTRSALLKRISTLRRLSDVSEDDFRREWKVHGLMVQEMPGVAGYRQNVLIARERTKGQPCGHDELPIDGIVELWLENPTTLDAAFASPQGQRTMAHAKTFLAEITALLVEERRIV